MPSSLPVLIHGATGRMGRSLLRLLAEDRRFRLAAAVGGRSAPPPLAQAAVLDAAQLDSAPAAAVVVDFSLPQAFERIVEFAVARSVPLVSGTTGLQPPQLRALDAAAAHIPVVWASNFSLGVALLEALVAAAAQGLPDWDCHILDAHHAGKRDAPSGTALTLGRAVEVARDVSGEPTPVGYASIRAGDIVGEHTVQFTGVGERLELVHRAANRDIFARGALEAAWRVVGRTPGRYRLGDLLSG